MIWEPNWYQIGNKTCYVPKINSLYRKRISFFANLKVSSLACSCVFYRLEQNSKGGPHRIKFWRSEMQAWSIPMDRAQRVDHKNQGHLSW